MIRYTVRRFLEMLLTLFIIATATFFLLEAIPGDPLSQKVQKLPQNIKEAMYEKYGYNKPVGERYMKSMIGILGILAAMNRGTWVDHTIVTIAILLISVPSFIFALGLQKIFAGNLGWFPIIGWPKGKDLWFGGWKYTVLPTLSGCFIYIAGYSRLLKTSMLDVINQDYVLTAKSKGLSNRKVVKRHILRNSIIPLITNLPITIAMCITGSFFIERVFSIPGLGLYYVGAVQGQDLPMIMGQTVIITAMYVVCIFITDILYTVADPRIRIAGGKR